MFSEEIIEKGEKFKCEECNGQGGTWPSGDYSPTNCRHCNATGVRLKPCWHCGGIIFSAGICINMDGKTTADKYYYCGDCHAFYPGNAYLYNTKRFIPMKIAGWYNPEEWTRKRKRIV